MVEAAEVLAKVYCELLRAEDLIIAGDLIDTEYKTVALTAVDDARHRVNEAHSYLMLGAKNEDS